MQQPEFVHPFKNEGEDVDITGCRIISSFSLTDSDIYWLKDGVQKIKLKVTSVGIGYSIENLQFVRSSYHNQGFYQCVVFSRGCMRNPIMSEKIHVQFAGRKFYIFSVVLKYIFGYFLLLIL